MTNNSKAMFGISILGLFVAGPSIGAGFSEAAKIGANSGAMSYCNDEIASDDDGSKYSLLSISAYKEYDDLASDDKLKALVYRKAAEDGDYLGDPLDEDRCDSIRKLLYLRYN